MDSARARFSFGVVCSSSALLLSLLCSAGPAGAATPDAEAPTTATGAPSAAELPSIEPAARVIETQPMQPGLGMLRAHVSAGDRQFFVFFGRGERPIAACSGECDFWAWPAKYRVVIRNGDGRGYDATVRLRLSAPGNYAFVPAHGGAQNTGLILGIAGPVIGLAGLFFTAAGLLQTCSGPPPGQSCDTPAALYIGLTGLVVGTGMTTAGWLLYAHEGPGIGLTIGGAAATELSVPFLLSTPDKIQPSAKTEFSPPSR